MQFSMSQNRNGGRDGGGGRVRTDDLLLAKQLLSQLSYAPVLVGRPRGGLQSLLVPGGDRKI
jgi:hypothetical protein